MHRTNQDTGFSTTIQDIEEKVALIAGTVEQALQLSLTALFEGNHELAYDTILGDHLINRGIRKIDAMCMARLSRGIDQDRDLRFLTAMFRVNVGLERLGDYAVTICREVVQLAQPLTPLLSDDLRRMGEDALRMLRQAIVSFNRGNVDLAKGAMGYADHVERLFSAVFEKLVKAGELAHRQPSDLFAIFTIFNMLERVSDQAKNICEETVYTVRGEVKRPKNHRVLFLEPADDYLGPMAVAIARKLYPEQGEFSSAGIEPAHQLNPDLTRYMESEGYDFSNEKPQSLSKITEDIENLHLLICFNRPVSDFLPKVPFHSTVLHWTIDSDAIPPEIAHQAIAKRLQQLMDILRNRNIV